MFSLNDNWIIFRVIVEKDAFSSSPEEVGKLTICGSARVLGKYQLDRGLKLKETTPGMQRFL